MSSPLAISASSAFPTSFQRRREPWRDQVRARTLPLTSLDLRRLCCNFSSFPSTAVEMLQRAPRTAPPTAARLTSIAAKHPIFPPPFAPFRHSSPPPSPPARLLPRRRPTVLRLLTASWATSATRRHSTSPRRSTLSSTAVKVSPRMGCAFRLPGRSRTHQIL
jgi:hypothetical protein